MTSPPSSDGRRAWHRLVEHYTPDGAPGRLLFGVTAGLGLGSFLFFAGIVQLTGPLSAFLLAELVALVSIPVGAALLGCAAVALWPVYLSLIGHLESASDYGVGETTHRSTASALDGDQRDEPDHVAALKRRYAAGEISEQEFERRLDGLLNSGPASGTAASGADSRVEREVE